MELIDGIKRFWRTIDVEKCAKYICHLRKVSGIVQSICEKRGQPLIAKKVSLQFQVQKMCSIAYQKSEGIPTCKRSLLVTLTNQFLQKNHSCWFYFVHVVAKYVKRGTK